MILWNFYTHFAVSAIACEAFAKKNPIYDQTCFYKSVRFFSSPAKMTARVKLINYLSEKGFTHTFKYRACYEVGLSTRAEYSTYEIILDKIDYRTLSSSVAAFCSIGIVQRALAFTRIVKVFEELAQMNVISNNASLDGVYFEDSDWSKPGVEVASFGFFNNVGVDEMPKLRNGNIEHFHPEEIGGEVEMTELPLVAALLLDLESLCIRNLDSPSLLYPQSKNLFLYEKLYEEFTSARNKTQLYSSLVEYLKEKAEPRDDYARLIKILSLHSSHSLGDT